MPLYLTSFLPFSSSLDILGLSPPYQSRSLSIFTKPLLFPACQNKTTFSQLRLKSQITSTILQYIQCCVVVSKTLGSHRVPNTGVLSSLSLRLLISLSYFGLLQPAETAPAIFAFACDLVSPSLPGCYCAESSLKCSFLLRNNPSRTSAYKSFSPLNSLFILHNHTKIHQQVIRQPFWLIAHYPSPLFRSLLNASLPQFL
jgi:hypothetical protein